MKTIKQILFPTDFSEMAKGAFIYALHLAKHYQAKLKLLHVYRGDFGVPVPEIMAYQMLEARKEESERNLSLFSRIASEAGLGDVELTTAIEMGLAVDVVVDYTASADEAIDLVVMGTKGEHNMAEVIFGSVTTGVIAGAKCPVIAVPEGVKEYEVKSIAYATDFKSENFETVQEAVGIAQFFGATLHCVRVETKGQDLNAEMANFNKITEQLGNVVDVRLAAIASDTVASGLDTYVQENGIDLILMSRPQRNLFERIFHRSVTKQVAMYAKVPVMVFRR